MQGDQKQFGEAFERYSDELFRHCLFRISDRDRALELTQEAFLRAWEFIERGGEVRSLKSFLYQVLRNLIIDEYRKKKTQSLDALQVDDEGGEMESMVPRDEADAMEAAMDRFDGERSLKTLRMLPEPYRETLVHRYIDGLSVQEIAGLLGASETAVSVRIHRGLKKMRLLLEREHV